MSQLDLFGNPITEPTPIIKSAKDEDDALRVVWRPYKGPSTGCQTCIAGFMMFAQPNITPAKWVRRDANGEILFCYAHKFETQDLEHRGIR